MCTVSIEVPTDPEPGLRPRGVGFCPRQDGEHPSPRVPVQAHPCKGAQRAILNCFPVTSAPRSEFELTFEGLVLHFDGGWIDVSELSGRTDNGVVLASLYFFRVDLDFVGVVVSLNVAPFPARIVAIWFMRTDTCSFVRMILLIGYVIRLQFAIWDEFTQPNLALF